MHNMLSSNYITTALINNFVVVHTASYAFIYIYTHQILCIIVLFVVKY
jgi:hypothetical protein